MYFSGQILQGKVLLQRVLLYSPRVMAAFDPGKDRIERLHPTGLNFQVGLFRTF
jgi:hypothetical protein